MPVRSRRSFSDRALARGRLYRTKSCPTGKLNGKVNIFKSLLLTGCKKI